MYYFIILEYDKNFTIEEFCILSNKNIKCLIFVAINIYSINIDNINIRIVVQ